MSFYQFIPLAPAVVRIFFMVAHSDKWEKKLGPSERNTEATRAVILGLAGLSFGGIVAITVLTDDAALKKLETAMFFLMVSFLAYFFSLGVQGYKNWVVVDMVSDTLMDIGSVSLIAFMISFIKVSRYGIEFQSTAIFVIVISWLIDFIARLIMNHRAYSNLR